MTVPIKFWNLPQYVKYGTEGMILNHVNQFHNILIESVYIKMQLKKLGSQEKSFCGLKMPIPKIRGAKWWQQMSTRLLAVWRAPSVRGWGGKHEPIERGHMDSFFLQGWSQKFSETHLCPCPMLSLQIKYLLAICFFVRLTVPHVTPLLISPHLARQGDSWVSCRGLCPKSFLSVMEGT